MKVAQETVAARQLLVDQITALYNNKLRSEVDVGFVDVNLSQAKLLLLQAQDQVQGPTPNSPARSVPRRLLPINWKTSRCRPARRRIPKTWWRRRSAAGRNWPACN